MIEQSGKYDAKGRRFAIVAGRFNEYIVKSLVSGAVDAITRCGGAEGDIRVVWVPGAFEIPAAARILVDANKFDAVVCLGAVIRGATPHFDHVAGAAARGIAGLAAEAPIPVVFGVLTCDTIEQAIERAGTKAGNKGHDAAMAAIEMTDLFAQLSR